ncbi:substrate-binding domain-containing protein [Oscillatoria nigro-viridis]|uniref:substrate-binding domain-containing protein n=1 Tax=Phormidium nigroviride TaxID=482564 RepID=UPI0029529403|nr:substrate-binding domain-containing protein [Oscillatoria nigro-viridis]
MFSLLLNGRLENRELTGLKIAEKQIAQQANPNIACCANWGNAQDWSKVGGPAGPIKVINRPAVSGTHQTFKEQVLGGGEFGTTANITTLDRDATTPLLQALGNNGIGYATFAQVANQKTVRVVPVNGATPDAGNYPYKRQLYYTYKNPPSQAVKDFLGYATSSEGQKAMLAGN